jgi:GNAT superfamily N-acetyltransferase
MLAIRPATSADIPLILSLIAELADYEKAPQEAKATPELLRRALFPEPPAGPFAECLIAELDGAPQAFALFFTNFSTWTGLPGIYLEDLFVRPAARNQGIGKALLQHIAGIAIERNCARFEWAVLDWNTPAIGFYEVLGATPMKDWTVFRLSGPALTALAAR